MLPLPAFADGASAYAAGAELGYQQNAAGQNREALVGSAQGQMGSLYLGNVTRPEASVFAGGKGDMSAAGMARKASCKIYVPTEGENLTAAQKAENAECAAVNMYEGGLATPTESISKSDPLLSMARRAASDPSGLLSEKGISLTTSELNCTPVVQTLAPTFTTETCVAGSDVKLHTCRRYKVVTVTQGYTGMGQVGQTMLAPFGGELYVYAKAGEEGLRLHTPTHDFLVPASGTFYNDVIGTPAGYRVVISSNGCASGTCRGTAMYQVLRDNGTWWSITSATFNQDLTEIFECPFDKVMGEGHWNGGGSVTLQGVGCPVNNQVTVQNVSRSATDFQWGSGSANFGTLTVGSANVSIYTVGQSCITDEFGGSSCSQVVTADLPASLSYSNGTFNLTYRAKNDSSSDSWGWFTTTWSLPSHQDSVVVTEIDECGELESLSQ